MDYIDDHRQRENADPELAVAAEVLRAEMQAEARNRIEELAEVRKNARKQEQVEAEENEDDDDDDYDVEVVYSE
jgi:GTP-binding protein